MSGPAASLTSTFSTHTNPSMAGKSDFTGLFQENKSAPVQAVFTEYSERNGKVVSEQRRYSEEELVDRRHREAINPNQENRSFNERQINQALDRMQNFAMDGLMAKIVPETTRAPQSILPPGYTPPTP